MTYTFRPARKMLSQGEIDAIYRMIAAGHKTKDIARTFGVSVPCIHAYKTGERKKAAPPEPFVMPKPHAMPWATRDMLMGARASVAKVRS